MPAQNRETMSGRSDRSRPVHHVSRFGRRSLFALLLLLTPACAHYHSVGLGATGSAETSVRQYYILWGLIAANDVDAQRMAPGLTSYEIVTRYGLLDLLLAPFLFPLTMTSRTVTVRT